MSELKTNILRIHEMRCLYEKTVFAHLIDGLHREVERHELYNRPETGEGGSHSDPSEPRFRDRSVLDSVVSVLLP